jgi:hypothetical protein
MTACQQCGGDKVEGQIVAPFILTEFHDVMVGKTNRRGQTMMKPKGIQYTSGANVFTLSL